MGVRSVVTAVAVAGICVGSLGSGAPAAAAGGCAPPYLPRVSGGAATDGPTLDHLRIVEGGSPDTDGDGRPDDVALWTAPALDQWRLVVNRGDGAVTLAVPVPPETDPDLPPGGFVFNRRSSWWGDFDGDGRDDLLVSVIIRAAGSESQEVSLHLVPGTVPPGVHDPRVVGVELPGATQSEQVGDQDGDGADDLLLPGVGDAGTIDVVSGRAAVAPGPGGRFERRPPALRTLPARPFGVLELGGPPTFVVLDSIGPDVIDLTVLAEPPVRLRTDRMPRTWDLWSFSVSGFRESGHRIVSLASNTRGGTDGWTWDLDGPCASATHDVRRGEWLWRIALDVLGPAARAELRRYAEEIHRVNRDVIGPDPDRLLPGVDLVLPPA